MESWWGLGRLKKGILSLWSSPFVCKRTSRSNSPKVKRAVNEGKKAPCPNSLGKRAKNGGGQIQQGKANRGHQDKFDNSRADLDLKKEMNEVKHKPIKVASMCTTDKKKWILVHRNGFWNQSFGVQAQMKTKQKNKHSVREIFWRWIIDLLHENHQ